MRNIMMSIFVFFLVCLQGVISIAQSVPIEKIPLAVGYAPVGFDTINQAQVVVEGFLPDSCHRVGPVHVNVAGSNIVVTQGAYKYHGVCRDIVTLFHKVIDLGIMREGQYSVVDGTSGKLLTTLPVVKAPMKSPQTYPDDYLYAPISYASVLSQNGRAVVVISGAYNDNCTQLEEIRTQVVRNVIQVLPITKRPDAGCSPNYRPFQYTKSLEVSRGHYLLHVRSISGNSANIMVDIP